MFEPTRKNINRLFNSAEIFQKNHTIEIKIISYLFLAEMPLRLDDIDLGLPIEKMLTYINNLYSKGIIGKYGRGTKWQLTSKGNALAEEWALRMDG